LRQVPEPAQEAGGSEELDRIEIGRERLVPEEPRSRCREVSGVDACQSHLRVTGQDFPEPLGGDAAETGSLLTHHNPAATRRGIIGGSGTLDDVAHRTSLALNIVDIPTVSVKRWQLRSYTLTAFGGEDTVYFGTAIAGNNNRTEIDDVSLTL